ncbi:hypothetical protein DFJ58DRAFT_734082 [Suillus subalutaceus]|uniref:uncharacterized protein n=1 Tax=Suillus subalutaceus TaxID=48586 RepID=UPI001B87E630|nr:uncharacterized protein DFJ58DRAFT_734082 [Suillus subalutaceus]KAG1837986.1 hypothetical protein DFJ58DRAFT_734082 [Suillus subalutaceus]
MPPKRSATKAEGLPRKKAKALAGTILSGISRSAPGDVNIGSMVDLPNGPSAQLKLSNILADDKSSGNTNTTSSPRPVATMAPIPPSAKILLASTNVSIAALSYANNFFHGAAAASISILWRSETKISGAPCAQGEEMGRTSPCGMHSLALFTSILHMRGGAHVNTSKKLAPGVEFIKCNIKAGFPPNTFLVVDTHSDEYTGMLQHTGGHAGGTNTTIIKILQAYLGEDFI